MFRDHWEQGGTLCGVCNSDTHTANFNRGKELERQRYRKHEKEGYEM